MAFGQRVRSRRTEMGIGLVDFVSRLGLPAPFLSRFERGRITDIDAALLGRIAEALGLDLTEEEPSSGPLEAPDITRALYRRMGRGRR